MLNTDIYIYIYIYIYIFFFFFWWRINIQPSSLPWILYSRWQPLSHVFSVALNFALACLYDACSVTNIPRGALGTRVNLDTCRRANSIWKWILCGRGNFWIRKEIVADSKIPGYVWRGPGWTIGWFATRWAFSEWYSSIWPSSTKSLSVSGISMQIVQMILTLRRGQKGWQ